MLIVNITYKKRMRINLQSGYRKAKSKYRASKEIV